MIFRRKTPPGFSVICAWNNREKLERFLLASLREQNFPHELLLIDNSAGKFKNAARILNETARKAKYSRLVFVHQDVALGSPDWFSNVWKTINRLRRFGAAGVAGRNEQDMFSNLTHSDPPQPACERWLKRPVRVQTLDGCLLIVPKDLFLQQGFDEKTCEGWYLYTAEFCLELIRRKRRVYVLPAEIYHESLGPADHSVYETTRVKLLAKHCDHLQTVYTTVGIWNT